MAVCADLANYGTTELPTAEFLTGGQVNRPNKNTGKNRGKVFSAGGRFSHRAFFGNKWRSMKKGTV